MFFRNARQASPSGVVSGLLRRWKASSGIRKKAFQSTNSVPNSRLASSIDPSNRSIICCLNPRRNIGKVRETWACMYPMVYDNSGRSPAMNSFQFDTRPKRISVGGSTFSNDVSSESYTARMISNCSLNSDSMCF